MKEIDLKKSVYELTETYPELIDFLKEPTIPQGCERQGKDLNEVIKKLEQAGFTVSR